MVLTLDQVLLEIQRGGGKFHIIICSYFIIIYNHLLFFVYFDIVNVGSHLEGPFINPAMKGAHKEHLMRQLSTKGAQEIEEFYGSLDHVSIITLAPELAGENMEAIQQLVKRNIVVSIGKETQYNVFNIYCVIISPDQLFWYESASKLSLAQNRGISLLLYSCPISQCTFERQMT